MKRPTELATLRREVRELRDEVARLRAELACRPPAAPFVPHPVPPPPASPWSPWIAEAAGCDVCRLSGVCNCVRPNRGFTVWSGALTAGCAPAAPVSIISFPAGGPPP